MGAEAEPGDRRRVVDRDRARMGEEERDIACRDGGRRAPVDREFECVQREVEQGRDHVGQFCGVGHRRAGAAGLVGDLLQRAMGTAGTRGCSSDCEGVGDGTRGGQCADIGGELGESVIAEPVGEEHDDVGAVGALRDDAGGGGDPGGEVRVALVRVLWREQGGPRLSSGHDHRLDDGLHVARPGIGRGQRIVTPGWSHVGDDSALSVGGQADRIHRTGCDGYLVQGDQSSDLTTEDRVLSSVTITVDAGRFVDRPRHVDYVHHRGVALAEADRGGADGIDVDRGRPIGEDVLGAVGGFVDRHVDGCAVGQGGVAGGGKCRQRRDDETHGGEDGQALHLLHSPVARLPVHRLCWLYHSGWSRVKRMPPTPRSRSSTPAVPSPLRGDCFLSLPLLGEWIRAK